jgi:hypothetical protein
MNRTARLLLLCPLWGWLGAVPSSTEAALNQAGNAAVTVSVSDYGRDVAAFRDAAAELARRGGGVLLIPGGAYVFDSRDLNRPIMLPGNVEVRGNGAKITLVGDAVSASVFAAHDASNILIKDLDVTGNSHALANSASGAFFQYTLTEAARASSSGIRLSGIRLDNFAAERWVSFINENAAGHAIRDVQIAKVEIVSRRGNSIAPSNIAVWAHGIVLMGYKGPITGVRITDFKADAAFIKSGIGILKRVSDVRIERAAIRSAGRDGAVDDAGGYAIALYGGPGEVSDVSIVDAVLVNPRSAGIYAAGAEKISITDALISGQSDVRLETLPKGALVFNGGRNLKIIGGRLSGNSVDVAIVARAMDHGPMGVVIDGLQTAGARIASIILNPGIGDGPVGDVAIRHSQLNGAGRALQVLNGISPSRVIAPLSIENSTLTSSTTNGIELSPYREVRVSGYVFRDLRISAKGIAVAAPSLIGDIAVSEMDVTGLGPDSVGFLLDPRLRSAMWSGVRIKQVDRSRIAPGRAIVQSTRPNSSFINVSLQ